MMMNLTFYFYFCVNTYIRFDNMLAAVETLDSYDCIESHHQYQGHLQVAISMNWKLKHSVIKMISMNSSQREKKKNILRRWGQWRKKNTSEFLHIMWKRGNVRPIPRDIISEYFFLFSPLKVGVLFCGWAQYASTRTSNNSTNRERESEWKTENTQHSQTHRSLSSTLCSCWAFLSFFSSSSSWAGRLIRKIHGSQYKNTTRTFLHVINWKT